MPRRTQGVEDLVRAAIANLPSPYGQDVIEDVCLEIEHNQVWSDRYGQLSNELGRNVVNNWIGQYKKTLTDRKTIRQVLATRCTIMGSYTKLS